MPQPVRIFISYSHKDRAAHERLVSHLAPLRRANRIAPWTDREILPGTDWSTAIDDHLATAQIILLLVSASFVASDYCFEKEMRFAMTQHEAGAARVIPIIIRPVDFSGTPFARLQALPRDARPVSQWTNKDEGWVDVVKGIGLVVQALGG